MNTTTTDFLTTLLGATVEDEKTGAIVTLALIAFWSEVLPLMPCFKANGLVHTVVLTVKKVLSIRKESSSHIASTVMSQPGLGTDESEEKTNRMS